MIRCNEGHLYDPARHTGCPWCGSGVSPGGAAPAAKTVALTPGMQPPSASPAAPPPPPAAPFLAPSPASPVAPQGKTVRMVEREIGIDPVVGWLVATAGPMRGQDFPLHAEKNFIGRDPAMQVCLSRDSAVSREKHASVVFEPKKRTFWLTPGDASGLVYRNGEVVHTPTPLQERDAIEVGGTTLVLILFVNDSFQWEAS